MAASEISRVPRHDGVGDQVERADGVSLGLQVVDADAAGVMEEDRALKCVLRLALLAGGLASLSNCAGSKRSTGSEPRAERTLRGADIYRWKSPTCRRF